MAYTKHYTKMGNKTIYCSRIVPNYRIPLAKIWILKMASSAIIFAHNFSGYSNCRFGESTENLSFDSSLSWHRASFRGQGTVMRRQYCDVKRVMVAKTLLTIATVGGGRARLANWLLCKERVITARRGLLLTRDPLYSTFDRLCSRLWSLLRSSPPWNFSLLRVVFLLKLLYSEELHPERRPCGGRLNSRGGPKCNSTNF